MIHTRNTHLMHRRAFASSKRWLSLACLVLMAVGSSPTEAMAQNKAIDIKQIEEPDDAIAVFPDFPDKAVIVIYSDIPNLQIDSNMEIVVYEDEIPELRRRRQTTEEKKYFLIVEPTVQIISFNAQGYVEQRMRLGGLKPRENIYFEVKISQEEVPDDVPSMTRGSTL